MTQGVCILGSTGSIGTSTLDVINRNRDKYRVDVLTANTNIEKLYQQCLDFTPKLVVVKNEIAASKLKSKLAKLNFATEVQSGEHAINHAANFSGVSIVVAAIVGAAGLLPTLSAIKKGHKILLANKEALVMSGELFIDAVKKYGATLLPVDSEHNAIFQCLATEQNSAVSSMQGVDKILLTGSGGPFRNLPIEELDSVTPEQACAHPNWDMGDKISVDSATMMNKGLELIEACFLFDVTQEKIDIVIHPQSIIHSMVSYRDGSVISQMGNPDMRTPIAYCLAWPDRIDAGVTPLDFYNMKNLSFSAPDFERFPCLKLAMQAIKKGGAYPCVLNAANEVAVNAFLNNQIIFTDIAKVIEHTLNTVSNLKFSTIEDILEEDKKARYIASEWIAQRGNVA